MEKKKTKKFATQVHCYMCMKREENREKKLMYAILSVFCIQVFKIPKKSLFRMKWILLLFLCRNSWKECWGKFFNSIRQVDKQWIQQKRWGAIARSVFLLLSLWPMVSLSWVCMVHYPMYFMRTISAKTIIVNIVIVCKASW